MATSTNTYEQNVAFLKRLEHLATQINYLLVAKGAVLDDAENHVWNRPDLDIEYFEENDGPVFYTLMTLAQHPTVSYGVNNQPSLGLAFVGPNNFVLRFNESMQDSLALPAEVQAEQTTPTV